MSVVDLPAEPGLAGARVRPIGFGERIDWGASAQDIIQPGARWSLEVRLPQMRSEPHGRRWAAALAQGKFFGVRARFIQDGFAVRSPGSPVVDGAGQAGMTLKLKDVPIAYAFRVGQYFTLTHGGRGYLHQVAALTIAGTDGKATLTIVPPLRVKPANGAQCNFATPTIEGTLAGGEIGWDVLLEPYTDFGPIRIDEDA